MVEKPSLCIGLIGFGEVSTLAHGNCVPHVFLLEVGPQYFSCCQVKVTWNYPRTGAIWDREARVEDNDTEIYCHFRLCSRCLNMVKPTAACVSYIRPKGLPQQNGVRWTSPGFETKNL